jgi:hypothetical protein
MLQTFLDGNNRTYYFPVWLVFIIFSFTKNRQRVSVVFASQNVTGTKIKLTYSIFWYSWFAVKKNEFGQEN